MAKKINAIHLIDVVHPYKIGAYLGNFTGDALSLPVLAYQGAKKIAKSFA